MAQFYFWASASHSPTIASPSQGKRPEYIITRTTAKSQYSPSLLRATVTFNVSRSRDISPELWRPGTYLAAQILPRATPCRYRLIRERGSGKGYSTGKGALRRPGSRNETMRVENSSSQTKQLMDDFHGVHGGFRDTSLLVIHHSEMVFGQTSNLP
jgi:hypothetical protein